VGLPSGKMYQEWSGGGGGQSGGLSTEELGGLRRKRGGGGFPGSGPIWTIMRLT